MRVTPSDVVVLTVGLPTTFSTPGSFIGYSHGQSYSVDVRLPWDNGSKGILGFGCLYCRFWFLLNDIQPPKWNTRVIIVRGYFKLKDVDRKFIFPGFYNYWYNYSKI